MWIFTEDLFCPYSWQSVQLPLNHLNAPFRSLFSVLETGVVLYSSDSVSLSDFCRSVDGECIFLTAWPVNGEAVLLCSSACGVFEKIKMCRFFFYKLRTFPHEGGLTSNPPFSVVFESRLRRQLIHRRPAAFIVTFPVAIADRDSFQVRFVYVYQLSSVINNTVNVKNKVRNTL